MLRTMCASHMVHSERKREFAYQPSTQRFYREPGKGPRLQHAVTSIKEWDISALVCKRWRPYCLRRGSGSVLRSIVPAAEVAGPRLHVLAA